LTIRKQPPVSRTGLSKPLRRWYTVRGQLCLAPRREPVALPPDSETVEEPAPGSAERLSYLDAGGRLASRETAQFAVVRDFDDRGNVISLMTERLRH
jgi:hypothetical protein